jgi:integrase
LQWSSIAFETGTMHVRRAKGGQEAMHPLLGDELRALRELKRQAASPTLAPAKCDNGWGFLCGAASIPVASSQSYERPLGYHRKQTARFVVA